MDWRPLYHLNIESEARSLCYVAQPPADKEQQAEDEHEDNVCSDNATDLLDEQGFINLGEVSERQSALRTI